MQKKSLPLHKIRALQKKGYSLRDIGAHFGVSHSRIHQVLTGYDKKRAAQYHLQKVIAQAAREARIHLIELTCGKQ